MNDIECHSGSLDYGKTKNFYCHSVVKWHEATHTFAGIHHVREMTSSSEKTCKYSEYGLFEHYTLLVCFFVFLS